MHKYLKLVTVKVPETYVEAIDELVKIGRYSSRSELIRIAIREFLNREYLITGYGKIAKKRKRNTVKVIEIK